MKSLSIRPALLRLALFTVGAFWLIAAGSGNVMAADAPTWSQFLGPQRNGISPETGLIDKFPADEPKVVWRVEGGVGMSGIALAEGKAVTLIEREGQQVVIALEAATGKTLWTTPLAPAYRNAMGDGPRGTPTIVEGQVFAFTGEGILAALALDSGKVHWQHNVVKQLGGKPAEYGMACSPLVVGERVIVTSGARGATVVALQRDSGEVAWKTGNDTAGYSSPTLLTLAGKPQVVTFTGSAVLGLNPQTGEQLWRYDFETNYDCNIATPIAVEGKLFVSAGENHGSALLDVGQLDANGSPREVWTSFGVKSVLRSEWQTPVLLDGYLYGMDNVGGAGPITHLACIEATTGELAWRETRFGKSNLIAADGKLIIITFAGELVLVRATPERFEQLDRAKVLGGETRQAPALLEGKLYLRDGQEIVCVDMRAEQ